MDQIDDNEIVMLLRTSYATDEFDHDFDRDWDEYVAGFGRVDHDVWIGLEALHQLTSINEYSLEVKAWGSVGSTYYSNYNSIHVGPCLDNYRLTLSGYEAHATHPAGDALLGNDTTTVNGMMFSTRDRMNRPEVTCPREYTGGWWYNECFVAHPTGEYLYGHVDENGVGWSTVYGDNYSFTNLEMKLIRKPVAP